MSASQQPPVATFEEPAQPTPPTDAAKPAPEQVAQQVLDSRDAQLFRPSNIPFNSRTIQFPDSFFEPSESELNVTLKSYTESSQRLQNATMKTSKMRKAETQQRMSRFKKVLIRIVLPDRFCLQGVFTPDTPIRQVVRFVRAALIDARNVKFHLFVVPPKRVLSQLDATLWDEHLVPAALLHLGIDDGPSTCEALLKPSLVVNVTDTPESKAQAESLATEPASSEKALSSNGGPSDTPVPDEKAEKPKAKKIPKWFKK